MVGAVVVWFVLAILYEGLKTLREYLIYVDLKHQRKYNRSNRRCQSVINSYDKSDKTSLIVSEDCQNRATKG